MKYSQYSFGTDETAERRLESIASFFHPHSVEAVRSLGKTEFYTVLDLGCGPGFSTSMLSEAVQAARLVGMDQSAEYLLSAKSRFPQIDFIRHDVTRTPFPFLADLIYCRNLLVHLPDCCALVDFWSEQLEEGGFFIAEEIETINTQVKAFRRYLDINEALLRSKKARLFAGGLLAKGDYRFHVVQNRTVSVRVENSEAASWFAQNTRAIWKKHPFILENFDHDELSDIQCDLDEIACKKTELGHTEWVIRRLAVQKKGR